MSSRKKKKKHEDTLPAFKVDDDVLAMGAVAEFFMKQRGGGWTLLAPKGKPVIILLDQQEKQFCTLSCKGGEVKIEACPEEDRQEAERLLTSFKESQKKS